MRPAQHCIIESLASLKATGDLISFLLTTKIHVSLLRCVQRGKVKPNNRVISGFTPELLEHRTELSLCHSYSNGLKFGLQKVLLGRSL